MFLNATKNCERKSQKNNAIYFNKQQNAGQIFVDWKNCWEKVLIHIFFLYIIVIIIIITIIYFVSSGSSINIVGVFKKKDKNRFYCTSVNFLFY